MVDRYTKAVLTVIAASLMVIALRGTGVGTAVAQSGPVHVIVDQFLFQHGGAAIRVNCDNCLSVPKTLFVSTKRSLSNAWFESRSFGPRWMGYPAG
jgi:hypothetical protein